MCILLIVTYRVDTWILIKEIILNKFKNLAASNRGKNIESHIEMPLNKHMDRTKNKLVVLVTGID